MTNRLTRLQLVKVMQGETLRASNHDHAARIQQAIQTRWPEAQALIWKCIEILTGRELILVEARGIK